MRTAETVLDIIRERGKKRLPLDDVYRQLYNPELYIAAYGRIYANQGAMTKGMTTETVDGMSMAKIETIINALRCERYRWTPVRRVHIPKRNGRTQPLGIPTWSDKLLQEVMRLLLEAYYEPQFSDHSHGFRRARGCHTALDCIQRWWKGTKWFIEGDITGCFDNIDHEVLLSILGEKIHDNRLLRLLRAMLKAGYCELWIRRTSLSGTPQGGIISPLLANIYLDKLDQFVEHTLIPAHTRGKKRKRNPAYRHLAERHARLRRLGRRPEALALKALAQRLPSQDTHDPDYRRLRYVRYADDFLLGFVGPKEEANAIKAEIGAFLRETLKLELSVSKTLITHASTESARFLGYDVTAQQSDTKHDRRGQRSVNGRIALRVPAEFIQARRKMYERNGKAHHRAELLVESDFDIIALYQQEYRGYVEFYGLAQNLSWLAALRWTMETSLLKTLASKHKMSVSQAAQKYRAVCNSGNGPRRCFRVKIERPGQRALVATFGGISLARRKGVAIEEVESSSHFPKRTELSKRLLANICEACGRTGRVEVHHVRKLADLKKLGRREPPLWVQMMSARKRKTLVLCGGCHDDIHAGRPLNVPHSPERMTGEPDDAKVSRPVRRGVIGKGPVTEPR